MARHQQFTYKTADQLRNKARALGIVMPFTEDVSPLTRPVAFGRLTAPNAMAIHPMEGCDALPDGAPGDLTVRRYKRFAAGGAGLIWMEACAVDPRGKANPRQLSLNKGNVGAFKRMLDDMRREARRTMGRNHRPVIVLQMTHSGRYSKPHGKPAPVIAHHSKVLDSQFGLPPDYPLITDGELDRLQLDFVRTARLAVQAGFDAVDIKSCHRYLIAELHASYTRRNSRYGGSFENRTRMLRETAEKVVAAVGRKAEVTCRLNAFDAIPYPYGFGVNRDDCTVPDLAEPLKLIGELRKIGFNGINVSIGNPYYNPHYGRPYDEPISGGYTPGEHPLESMERYINVIRTLQETYPGMTVIGGGYSWIRHHFPQVAAAVLEQGWAGMIGLGRNGFAYPDFARDIVTTGKMDPAQCCIACSSCTQIMRDGGRSGCVPKDGDVYGPIYREGRMNAPDTVMKLAAQCRNCQEPSCVEGCAAGIDIPGFVTSIAAGKMRRAYDIIRRSNALPEMCGRVCPVEVQCEGKCVQNLLGDGPVPIKHLQRWVSELARKEGWDAIPLPEKKRRTDVAVVGAGPSGVACAVRLLEQGHRVTLYDAGKERGGLVTSVIPGYRSTAAQADGEAASVLASAGKRVTWKKGFRLGKTQQLDTLAKKHDAVYLSMGLPEALPLKADAKVPDGVEDALSFLKRMKGSAHPKLAGSVAVIGGGNSAMDAALVAKRAGAGDVYLVYRRSFAELPAWPEERDAVLNAGVHFLVLSQPVGYTRSAGKLKGVKVVRTALGAPDSSGRRRPEPVKGSGYVLPVDRCVEAIGQMPDPALPRVLPGVSFNRYGTVAVDDDMMTARTGVFAGGDLVNGGATVVRAVADGQKAAAGIHRYLAGK